MINDFYVQLGTIISGLLNYPFLVSEIENISKPVKGRTEGSKDKAGNWKFPGPELWKPKPGMHWLWRKQRFKTLNVSGTATAKLKAKHARHQEEPL